MESRLSARTHLRLLEQTPPPSLRPPPQRIDLTRAPFRPGELPQIRTLHAGHIAVSVQPEYARDPAPVVLLVRVLVEASRIISAIAGTTGENLAVVEAVIDRHLGDVAPSAGLTASERYARAVASAPSRLALESAPAPVTLQLFLSPEMDRAWSCAAAQAGQTWDEWVTNSLDLAPPPARALHWEAVTASRGQTLAEGCYAAFLAS